MEKVSEFSDVAMKSLTNIWLEITKIFPNIIGALIVLIIGWLITKLVVKIIKKVLKLAKANKLDDKINEIEIVEGKKLNFDTIKVVSKVVKYLMYIILLVTASDIMGLDIITKQISDLISYLPKLFAALVVFIVGLLFANFVKNGLKSLFESMDLSGGKMISQVVFFLMLTFISITALNQAGIDTEIITNNINMIIAAFLLAFAIAFGFGAREVVGKLLNTFYARKTFEVGQSIKFNNVNYTIEEVKSISVVLKSNDGKLIVPINELTENQVQLQD
ncbi:mechanosensitive ion channel [Winogradskyella echinorum]|uniref:Mechanosensitive ion channel n=1 Tax=Winogradskyella echinorum TaxID=538189 RepID=A0ABR6Y5E7_9FLAO|nr:mechanosensitive ion channel domain-containing protein [Winogradskyella echinorum]MBC3847972.1 mechanosensitive ion channel [Winogradskyella echinorum]MBC5752320.1 mechanosensitive ion channel [Winogradskyella echinorum]